MIGVEKFILSKSLSTPYKASLAESVLEKILFVVFFNEKHLQRCRHTHTHIHSNIAEKKESVTVHAIPICHLPDGLPSDCFCARCFALFGMSTHFIQSQKNSAAIVFFTHEFIFWGKCFQFHHVIFNHLIQGGIWNTQVFLSDIVSLIFHSQR